MAYVVLKPTGANPPTPITIMDNSIDETFYDSSNTIGLQIPGRNSVNYGNSIAQNTIQMVSNFAGTVVPKDSIALQGQLWFNATSATTGNLYVRTSSSSAGGLDSNWKKVVTVDSTQTGTVPVVNPLSGTEKIGDLQVVGTSASIYTSGGWKTIT